MTDVIAWLVGHQIVVAMLAMAVLDLLFALKPDWASNGLLHLVYLLLVKKSKPELI